MPGDKGKMSIKCLIDTETSSRDVFRQLLRGHFLRIMCIQ